MRFQNSFRIKQIAVSLHEEDNIKVSRKSISTFLKKYIETNSINDKPRSGRNKKLTPEEINLIGEITRLNRDITAPKIKEYLNLNVSTYTILRASKLFEWNKLNPNSNEAKKAASLKRQQNGESRRQRSAAASSKRNTALKSNKENNQTNNEDEEEPNLLSESNNLMLDSSLNDSIDSIQFTNPDLGLISEYEILAAKNASSSPMVFATKMLYKIFELNELLGHNCSGKTFNKYVRNKKALDEKRVNYIKWLVDNYFESNSKEEIWKACRTAINKSIRNNELKGGVVDSTSNCEKSEQNGHHHTSGRKNYTIVELNENEASLADAGLLNLEPNLSIFQMTNELPNLDITLNKLQENNAYKQTSSALLCQKLKCNELTSVITLMDTNDLVEQFISDDTKAYADLNSCFKKGLFVWLCLFIFE